MCIKGRYQVTLTRIPKNTRCYKIERTARRISMLTIITMPTTRSRSGKGSRDATAAATTTTATTTTTAATTTTTAATTTTRDAAAIAFARIVSGPVEEEVSI